MAAQTTSGALPRYRSSETTQVSQDLAIYLIAIHSYAVSFAGGGKVSFRKHLLRIMDARKHRASHSTLSCRVSRIS